ncbi:hypothetical protein F4677DRAFT_439694 [Hypoxylon crocopeplum]|nr:hypothetical protein F4677DRAFT_439694 [Hypoxylon crocopeplum]
MAAIEASAEAPTVSIGSYDTALCIIPPKHLWPAVDRLRMVYDSAYKKWPPHINLVYPFVPTQSLPRASELIVSQLQKRDENDELDVRLDTADLFVHGRKNTIFIHDKNPGRASRLRHLREVILESLGHTSNDYQMHMTVGQTKDIDSPLHNYTLKKASLLPALEWKVNKIYVMIRDKNKAQIDEGIASQMEIWGEIDLTSLTLLKMQSPIGFSEETTNSANTELNSISNGSPQTRVAYAFSPAENKWTPQRISLGSQQAEPALESLVVASYNVQAEFQYPPTRARYPIIIQNLLDETALADVLILEEVTDDFLSYLCKERAIHQYYPFVSNGPPDQADIEPLPNHINTIVLSKWPFSWDLLSVPSSSRGSVVMRLSNIGKHEKGSFLPVILCAVHLTSGLTNISVEKKKQELQSILGHLARAYPRNPWILAGDFNITTSVYGIETAIKRKEISVHTKATLGMLEAMLTEAGLVDTWTSACVQYGDLSELGQSQEDDSKALGGEQGATFDPRINDLAADPSCGDLDKRPQRYDRILIRGKDLFAITGFNMFGQSTGTLRTELGAHRSSDCSTSEASYGSDHWGIRCALRTSTDTSVQPLGSSGIMSIGLKPASAALADISGLTSCLSEKSVFPSAIDMAMRETAFSLLKDIILPREDYRARGLPVFVMVPVGSYGLGVWTASSDIDCLCIGPISSKTFFTLAVQRLREAAPRGVKILRRVDAHSGTMLELEVGQIRMDLQYCSAITIAETWPAALALPPTDPVFKLSPSALVKLKPIRDLHRLRRTIPDFAAFKLAYQFITCWAKRRGIYAAKFGYLSGIQISILLSRVCKLLSHDGRAVSVPTILTTFFHHYAGFDWEKDVVFDPFHHKRLSYVRTTREPMAILGFHGPSLNTAHTASLPTVHVISEEFKRADALLSDAGMTWPRLLGEDTGALEFLNNYTTYIKITAQFWGVSLAKGNGFVGWLESRCALLLVELGRQVPHLNPRVWPARFVNQSASEEDTEYEGHYLIGLDTKDSGSQATTLEETALALGNVRASLYKFETQITTDPKYFDPKSSWMSAGIVSQSELGKLLVDDRDWGKYTVEAEDDDIGDSEFWASIKAEEEPIEPRKRNEAATRLPSRPSHEGKLRPAGDVLNRLRWDQAMDSGDYIVGYEDRFSGAMERSVDSWKSETTHEEFIPEHRIIYFKRKSDGTVVWDREGRRDEIFGSGVSSIGH